MRLNSLIDRTRMGNIFKAILWISLISALPIWSLAQSTEESRLRELTQAFFKTYEQRSITEMLKWWNALAPDLVAYRQQTEKLYTDCSKIELTNLIVRRIEWEAQAAHVSVTLELNAVDARTNKPLADWAKLQRVLSWRQENNEWKIWRETSAYTVLAEKLVTAPAEADRKQLLAAAPELNDTELARQLNIIGRDSRNLASPNYILSNQAYQLAYEIAWQAKDKSRAAASLTNIAQNYYFQDDYESVLTYSQRGLQLSLESNNLSVAADALTVMAGAHGALGHYAEAKVLYERIVVVRQELRDPLQLADALRNVGRWYFLQSSYETSLELYQRALDSRLAFRLQNPTNATNLAGIGELQGVIALSYAELGAHTDALRLFEENLATAQMRGQGVGDVLNNIGSLYRRQGNYELALKYYRDALQANEEQKSHRLIAVSLNHIGNVLQTQGQFAQAIEYHQRALTIGEQIKHQALLSKTYGYLGAALLAQRNPAEAMINFQKGLDISRHLNLPATIAESCLNLATAYFEQKDFVRARALADEALGLSRHSERPELRYSIYTLAGQLYWALGQPEQARQAMLEAISAIEGLRTQVVGSEQDVQIFFENKTTPYLILNEIALSQNLPQEALRYAESAKARTLLDVLQSGKRYPAKALTATERKQEGEISNQLALINGKLYKEQWRQQPNQARLSELLASQKKTRLNLEDFRTHLYAAHPELKVQRGEANALTMEEAAELLPDEKTALLNYLVTPEHVRLFVLTKAKDGAAKLRVYPLAIKREALTAQVEQFRAQLAGRDARFGKLAREMYSLLLKPAQADLPPQARLMIVPDGPLWELPFQALLTSQQRFLWEDHVIAYAPSLTVLREMTKTKRDAGTTRAAQSLFAIGDPSLGGESIERLKSLMGGSTLGQLPEARTQVETLRKFYDANRSKVFTGEAAAEATVKSQAGKFDILHFATHGVLNNRNPLYSYLLLAQNDAAQNGAPSKESPKEDGLLEAWEIMQMDLHADLAVLSACETARGRVGAGEGMIGLTWALFVAGVPTTIVSQWEVRADSTADLMIEFHRQLQLRKAESPPRPASEWTKAEALRLAALKLLRSGRSRHPFYWAGFVLVGQPR
ncbi:MAG: CHAT domain-containing tetratricopeptide repeat protein [Acidobacteriota bacterium]